MSLLRKLPKLPWTAIRWAAGLIVVVAVMSTSAMWWPPLSSWIDTTLASHRGKAAGEEAEHDDHAGHDRTSDKHGADAQPAMTSLELTPQARMNLGLTPEYLKPIELSNYRRSITVPAVVVAKPGRSSIFVSSPLNGVVTHVHAVTGEAVLPGDLLMEVRLTYEDLVETQTAYLKTISELEVENREITRLEEATQSGAISGKLLLERRYAKEKLEAFARSQREALRMHGLSDRQVGYLDRQGPSELLVRSLGRIQSIDDLKKVPVTVRDGRPLLLSQVATVVEAAQVKRGDSSAFVRNRELTMENGESDSANPLILNSPTSISPSSAWSGGPAVVLTINKQPGADTRRVTDDIMKAIEELQPTMPVGVRIMPVYSQKIFIDRAIANVIEALRDGVILVVIVLFLFLMNVRTTFITLTAIPLSLVMTAIVFSIFGLSINTMTLGGLAVAMGELVDDAIVDVENIFRRLRENRLLAKPLNPL